MSTVLSSWNNRALGALSPFQNCIPRGGILSSSPDKEVPGGFQIGTPKKALNKKIGTPKNALKKGYTPFNLLLWLNKHLPLSKVSFLKRDGYDHNSLA